MIGAKALPLIGFAVEIRAGIAGYVNVTTTSIHWLLNRRIEKIRSLQWRLLVLSPLRQYGRAVDDKSSHHICAKEYVIHEDIVSDNFRWARQNLSRLTMQRIYLLRLADKFPAR